MKKILRKIPYTHRIALVILLFTLLPCCILGSFYLKKVQAEWKEDILKEYQSNADFNALIASKNITELQSKMQYLLNNFQIRTYLTQIKDMDILKGLAFVEETDDAVSSITIANQDLVVRWYSYHSPISYGKYCYTMERFVEEFPEGPEDPDYKEILQLKEGDFLWMQRSVARGDNNRGPAETRLCLYTQLNTMYNPGCILEFSIPATDLVSIQGSHPAQESIFSLSLNQKANDLDIILSSILPATESHELLAQYHAQHELKDYDIIRAPIPNVTDSEILFLVPKTYASEIILPKIVGFIGIAVLIVILILVSCYLTSYLLTRRIIHAISLMNADLNSTLKDSTTSEFQHDDFGEIAMRVRKLVQDSREYCLKIERYETESLRMELELLQLRFNPHLLYNTLDAIYYQVKNPDTRRTIHALCNYYRIVLNNGHLVIRIKDELDMIKDYLSIVKFAYGLDNISCEFEIDEQITQYAIIKHLLQPIVENALNHGIRPAGCGGTLKINALAEEACICITVLDNGVGMSKEDSAHLLKEPSASVSKGGYGIYNVQQRIQLYYGKEYGLEIDSTPGEGTAVTMRIPKMLPE